MAEIFSRQTEPAGDGSAQRLERIRAGLSRRHARERRFRAYGMAAIVAALGFVAILFSMILYKGLPAFTQATLTLDVHFDPEVVSIEAMPVREQGQSEAEYRQAMLGWQRK